MRILLAGTSLHRENVGGAVTFFGGLVRGLVAVAREENLQLAVVAPDSARAEVVKASDAGVIDFFGVEERRGARRLFADWNGLDAAAREWTADVVHYPHEWAPSLSVPVVLTIQNVGWLHPASRGEFGTRGRALRVVTRRRARQGRIGAVTAVSEQAAGLWCDLTGRALSDVVVIPEPVELPPPRPFLPATEPFFIGFAGDGKYKNLELLLAGYAEARRFEATLPRLVVVGLPPRGAAAEGVEQLGWIPRSALLDLMFRCAGVVFPSAVESFGLPYYESLSQGRPCLVLAGTPMAATRFPGTIVVEPSISGLAAGLRGLAGTAVPASVARRVIDQLAPPVVARAYVDVYRNLTEGR